MKLKKRFSWVLGLPASLLRQMGSAYSEFALKMHQLSIDLTDRHDSSENDPEDALYEAFWSGYDTFQELELLRTENEEFSYEVERLAREVSELRRENLALHTAMKKLTNFIRTNLKEQEGGESG